MKRIIILSLLSGMGIAVIPEAIGALYLTRVQPKYERVSIANPTFHAGEGIEINRTSIVPDNCIPRYRRYFRYDDGRHWTLTDAASTPNGPDTIPTPPSMHIGCGILVEQLSAQGCGWLAGVFPPLGAISPPLRACVLPSIPPPSQ